MMPKRRWPTPAKVRTGSTCNRPQSRAGHTSKAARRRLFYSEAKITSSRALQERQEQQVRREQPVQQEPKRQQQVPEQVREQRQEQGREREPVRAPSCHMQPEQRRR